MRYSILMAACLLAAGCANDEPVETSSEDLSKLAAELRGYEPAGPPVSCVSLRNLDGNRSVGEGAIVFDGPGSRKWVNRPPAGCPSLEFGRALHVRTSSSQLCRNDIVTVLDPGTDTQYGACGLGDFEPYDRVRN